MGVGVAVDSAVGVYEAGSGVFDATPVAVISVTRPAMGVGRGRRSAGTARRQQARLRIGIDAAFSSSASRYSHTKPPGHKGIGRRPRVSYVAPSAVISASRPPLYRSFRPLARAAGLPGAVWSSQPAQGDSTSPSQGCGKMTTSEARDVVTSQRCDVHCPLRGLLAEKSANLAQARRVRSGCRGGRFRLARRRVEQPACARGPPLSHQTRSSELCKTNLL